MFYEVTCGGDVVVLDDDCNEIETIESILCETAEEFEAFKTGDRKVCEYEDEVYVKLMISGTITVMAIDEANDRIK